MKILVVIPVRGNSKGIPRKNIRFLNGLPLMAYSIQNAIALKEEFDADVVVDTEDGEIAEIAEQYGASVVIRPNELAGDEVTLDPVVNHALIMSEKKAKYNYDIVITMQATSPTLKAETIKIAINNFIRTDYDTMISAVNDAHLSWKCEDDKYLPCYNERVNRQYLPKSMKETGGFLITKRNCVNEKSRIGKKVTVFEISANEAVDIDTEHDWKLCESIMSSKKIILRADGEEKLGMGHIYRCLSLAYHLTGHEILFVTRKGYDLGIKKLEESNFKYKVINDNKDILKIINQYKPDILVNDILNTEKNYMLEIKKNVPRVVNFEDQGAGCRYADCVINALFTEKNISNEYNGFKYFFIRDEFLTALPKQFSEKVKNIVVLFGGTDPSDLTRKTYNILKQISKEYVDISFHIITGFGYQYKDSVLTNEECRIYVHNDVKRVSKYLAEADMAITAQGRTMYELACMGVPSIALAQNTRELSHVFANISNGFISLGIGKKQDNETIKSTIEWLINTPHVRRQMHELLLEKDFKKGQERVIKLILGESNGEYIRMY